MRNCCRAGKYRRKSEKILKEIYLKYNFSGTSTEAKCPVFRNKCEGMRIQNNKLNRSDTLAGDNNP